MRRGLSIGRRLKAGAMFVFVAAWVCAGAGAASAHPLGNFTINHYSRLEASRDRIVIRYVIDMAEIPALQELQRIDTDGDGTASSAELQAYAGLAAANYEKTAMVIVDGSPVALHTIASSVTLPAGAGGLSTLRLEGTLEAVLHSVEPSPSHRVRFEDRSYKERIGWRELVVVSETGVAVFDSTGYATGLSDELRAYPEDSLASPLDERAVEFTLTSGEVPADARPLLSRDGTKVARTRDRLAELIAVPELTLSIAMLGLLIAACLGALHAMSPGHGKTIVGAYLVGSRGTARHAAFLGLTVTITHTIGVFALGVITLAASQYVVPERFFPMLSFVSGGLVVAIGLSLFVRRVRAAFPANHHEHHRHEAEEVHPHDHSQDGSHSHSHGGRVHSHLPPGSSGSPITWRSLLALGISGGLLPCPSALVVLLSAIALHRVAYGLLLVVAFSVGLAATLSGVGLAFVYAGRFLARPLASSRVVRVLPMISALVITCAGAAICYEALLAAGLDLARLAARLGGTLTGALPQSGTLSTASVLMIGFAFGLKHAVEADHIAAVSTIVSERKTLLGSSVVGGLWGAGHTISLLIAGALVLMFRVKISESVSQLLEFCVALMLVALGVNALRKLLRGGKIHLHPHPHGLRSHAHFHLHEGESEPVPHSHHKLSFSARPVIVGMVHGLAGSAALMLVVLSTISSRMLGLAYIAVFGLGSIGGMMIMSALIGLPLRVTAGRFARANRAVRVIAAFASVAMGVYLVYQIGFSKNLIG